MAINLKKKMYSLNQIAYDTGKYLMDEQPRSFVLAYIDPIDNTAKLAASGNDKASQIGLIEMAKFQLLTGDI